MVFGEYGPLTFDPSERYLTRLHHNSFSPSCFLFGEQLNVLCFTHCLLTEGQSGSKQHVEMLLCFSPSVSALEILHQTASLSGGGSPPDSVAAWTPDLLGTPTQEGDEQCLLPPSHSSLHITPPSSTHTGLLQPGPALLLVSRSGPAVPELRN